MLIALGIGPGDEVINNSKDFYCNILRNGTLGASPVFADADLQSSCITPETIEPLITSTRAISVVHLGGWPADMPSIIRLAKS